jgi:hypothetical protein
MKKITIHKVRTLLETYGADESTIELIQNNISQYNAIVTEIGKGNHINQYLAYQLNVAITKQIEAVKKNNHSESEGDSFTKMIDEIKKKKLEQR